MGITKWKKIIKNCPICSTEFETQKGHPREKTTCGYSCSNTYFNGKTRNINFKNYRTICFKNHKRECVVCGESNVVAAHHIDNNHNNNNPSNLVPLCPTHHQYWHSRHRQLIESTVIEYMDNWKSVRKN